MAAPSNAPASGLDRLLPPAVRAGAPETLRRARLVLGFTAVLESQVVVFTLLYWALNVPQVSRLVFAVGVCLLTVPRVLRFSVAAAAHWLLLQLMLILDAVAFYTGGLHAPALYWTVAAPVLAMMAAGRPAGVVWLGVVSVNAVAFTVPEALGYAWPQLLASWASTALSPVAVAMLAFVVTALAWLYETTREQMVAALDGTNRDMRRVLDNVGQGFVVVDARGQLGAQRSAALEQFVGPQRAPDTPIWDVLGGTDSTWARWMATAWESVFEGNLPLAVGLDQLPTRLQRGGRTFGLTYRPTGVDARDVPEALVVVVADVTSETEAEHREQAERELSSLLQSLWKDRRGFMQFWEEAERLLGDLRSDSGNALRNIHTLKGNCAIFGLNTVARECHRVESDLAETGTPPTAEHVERLWSAWSTATRRIQDVVHAERNRLLVSAQDYDELEQAIARRVEHAKLSALVATWRYERTAEVLTRLGEQARGLAERLEKPVPLVKVEHHGMRVNPERWAPLWQALVHGVRNAVDHGIEPPEARLERGKPAQGTLTLVTRPQGDAVVVEIADDGGGVDWQRVAQKAAGRGLPCNTDEERVAALCADGLSTRDDVTEVSGRGVGMAAVLAITRTMGGELHVESSPGVGTTLRLRIPARGQEAEEPRHAA